MKIKLFLACGMMAVNVSVMAAVYPSGTLGASGTTIPDNNYLGTGDSLTYTLSDPAVMIQDVSLSFTLLGGYSGDLTGYLRLGNTLSSPAYDLTALIQSQTLSATVARTYTIDFATPGFQSTFDGLNPNDSWHLFFADTSAGDTTTLLSWSLDITSPDITPVPEPTTWALLIFFGVVGTWQGIRAFRKHRSARA